MDSYERLWRALDEAGIITGAWRDIPYCELPAVVREEFEGAVYEADWISAESIEHL